jgi:hypothetical protein
MARKDEDYWSLGSDPNDHDFFFSNLLLHKIALPFIIQEENDISGLTGLHGMT